MTPQSLNRDGVCLLAAQIIQGCIAAGDVEAALSTDRITQLDVALDWAVMCGMDAHDVARALVNRPATTERTRRAFRRDPNRCYTKGRTCPKCGILITNSARTCVHHRWWREALPATSGEE